MMLRIALYCVLGGLVLTVAAMGAGHFAWWWASGVLLAASFIPVARFGPRGALGQFGVIAPVLLIVTVLTTWSEALVFIPSVRENAARDLTASVVMYSILALVLSVLARAMRLTDESGRRAELRPAATLGLMILVCGGAYTLYYLVTGSITFFFFTKGYYPQAEEMVKRMGLWFWAMQVGRGTLMTLAVLPAISTLRMERRQAALAVGIMMWVAGGAAPLLVPNPLMGGTQRFIHMVEILTQNVPLGITAVLLLRRPNQRRIPVTAPSGSIGGHAQSFRT